MCADEIEPGLDGVEDSGSDSDHLDLPAPELPAGVQKTTLRQAAPTSFMKRPQLGDEVLIHYVGTRASDGCVLDSSRDRGAPLKFEVGKGEFLAGWDFGTTTMRAGDLARFVLSPSFLRGRGPMGEDAALKGVRLTFEVELLQWVRCVDLFGNGTVIKRMEQRPTDKRHPVVGQVCLLGYRLSLAEDGRVLEEVAKFERTIANATAHDQAPAACGAALRSGVLDVALLSMRRDERAKLCLSASSALGSGRELLPTVTPDTPLHVELDLHEFLETSDASFERDGTVVKRSLVARDTWPKCRDAGTCTLKVLTVKCCEETLTKDRTLCFVIGDGQVCDALECAATCLRVGEEATVTCKVAEMCADTQLGVTGAAPMTFHVKMERYEPGAWERARSDDEKIAFHASRKEVGTALFKSGRYRLAAHRFGKVHELLGYIDDYRDARLGEERRARIEELKWISMLNRALCLLKVGKFLEARSACDYVLEEHDSQNSKALFRRAQAHLGLEDCALALRDARAAAELEPRNVEVRELLVKIKGKQKEEAADTGPMYAKMCKGLGRLPHPLDVD